MERDFMGLNSKDHLVKVKEEVDEPIKEYGLPKGFGVTWSSSSKKSVIPHYMSMGTKDEKPPRPSPDVFAPPGFVVLTSTGGTSIGNNLHPAENQNFGSTSMTQSVYGRIPAMNNHLVHCSNAFLSGMTEPSFRCTSEPAGAPAELTIFYAGRVNVYTDISPEKAQAIMFLAGNGCSTSSRTPPEVKVVAPASNYLAQDDAVANTFINTSLCPALSSPMSVSSHPTGQTSGNVIKRVEPMAYKTVGTLSSTASKVPTSKLETSLGPSATSIFPSAVPQARKASLARFLEKRKERVMCSSPYFLGNKPNECTAESSADISGTSDIVSCSMSTKKDNL